MAVKKLSPHSKTFIPPHIRRVVVVGTGGTGSWLAEGLAQMVAGYGLKVEIVLYDPQNIEEKNLIRQNFKSYEVGHPKSQALAMRLNGDYGTRFGHYVGEYKGDGYTHCEDTLVITCTDNVASRLPFRTRRYWLDVGNGLTQGQAVFGTTSKADEVKRERRRWLRMPNVHSLPNASLIMDMEAALDEPDRPSCADTPFSVQGFGINKLAAHAALTIVHQILIDGQVHTPAIWFDSRNGRMSPAAITKEYMGGIING